MGAHNALRVYTGPWGARLPPTAFRVLVYMALTARDEDSEPWCGIGHQALAVHALGLRYHDADARGRAEALRKVRRAITPLRRLGAIETTRRGSYGERGPIVAVYRLYLDGPKPPDAAHWTP